MNDEILANMLHYQAYYPTPWGYWPVYTLPEDTSNLIWED